MSYVVKFHNLVRVRDGEVCPARVGVGTDGTLWLDPVELGMRGEELSHMAGYTGPGALVLVDSAHDRAYVNAQALAATQPDPKVREAMGRAIEMLLRMVGPTESRNDAVRNN